MAEDDAAWLAVMELVRERLKLSIEKHGDWSDYAVDRVFDEVAGEFDEYREAFVDKQIDGKHGQINELIDVAVVSLRGVVRLLDIKAECDREVATAFSVGVV